jgi:hypothetical protein
MGRRVSIGTSGKRDRVWESAGRERLHTSHDEPKAAEIDRMIASTTSTQPHPTMNAAAPATK